MAISGLQITLDRICEKCNRSYQLPMQDTRQQCWNMTTCPNCGERDDPWVRLKLEGIWRPIDTFPHPTKPYADGYDSKVLLASGTRIVVGYALYHYDDHGIPELYRWTIGDCWKFKPTHWAPLPDLPGASTEGDINV